MPRLPQSYPWSVNNPNYEKITPVDRDLGCCGGALRLLQSGPVQQHAWSQPELDGRSVDLEQGQQKRRCSIGECVGEQRDEEIHFVEEEEQQRQRFAFGFSVRYAVIAAGSLLRPQRLSLLASSAERAATYL